LPAGEAGSRSFQLAEQPAEPRLVDGDGRAMQQRQAVPQPGRVERWDAFRPGRLGGGA